MLTGGGDCNNYATYNKVKKIRDQQSRTCCSFQSISKYLTNMSELRLLSPRQVVMLPKVACTKWMMRSDIHTDEAQRPHTHASIWLTIWRYVGASPYSPLKCNVKQRKDREPCFPPPMIVYVLVHLTYNDNQF